MQYDIISSGHICLDITPEFQNTGKEKLEEVLFPGKLINIGKSSIHTGGSVPNAGIAMSILGSSVLLMGKIGKDLYGEIILSILRQYGVGKGIIIDPKVNTSYTIVIAPRGIDRIFLHHTGANDTFSAMDINYEVVSKAKLFHFGYPPLMRKLYQDDGRELIEIFRKAKELGVITSLDCTLPDPASESGKVNWRKILEALLPWVDIFCPSLEEALYMVMPDEYRYFREKAGGADFNKMYDPGRLHLLGSTILKLGCRMAFVKCGTLGCYLKTSGESKLAEMKKLHSFDLASWSGKELLAPAFLVKKVASTTGCGDSAVAGFLVSLLKGRSPENSLKNACAAGALTAGVYDSLSGLVPLERMEEMIRNGWNLRTDFSMKSFWRLDNTRQLYVPS